MRRPDLTLALFPLLALAACGTTPTSAPMDHHGHGAHHRGHRFDDDPAQWAKRFDDPARDAWQKPDAVIARLGLAADAQVADVGAGTGYFAVRLARAVPHGAVWAADIEPTMVAWLADRAAREDVVNLRPLLAKPADPALPTPVDVIFICNTWHHVADRPAWLKAATAQLKPGGRIAILDYRVDFEGDGPPKDLRLTQEAVIAELQAAGFSLQDREDGEFPRQYLLVFGRPTPLSVRRRLLLLALPFVALAAWGLLVPEVAASAWGLCRKGAVAVALGLGLYALGARGLLPRFLARRLVSLLIVLIGASTLVFGALRLAPGDPVDAILGEQASAEARAELAQALCLDRPLLAQYNDCFWDSVLDGSLGQTFDVTPRPVIELLAENFPSTAELALAGMVVALCIAFPLGLISALRRGTWVDHGASVFALLGVAVPAFWLGPMLLLALTVAVDWLPSPARTDRPVLALILPAITLGTALAGKLTRMIRSSVLEVAQDEYVVAARAKGLSEKTILIKHVLRNALIPVVTVMGIQFGALLTGAIITEKVFARPGVGTLLLEAIQQRDYPVVQGTVLLIATTYVVVNLATDLVYVLIDPRVRLDA